MKMMIGALVALALLGAAPARANCYEHCHSDGNGNTTCHTNCY